MKGVDLLEVFERVNAFQAISMINAIIAEYAVRDGMHEGTDTLIRSKIRDLQKTEADAPPGLEHLPPEKRVAPTYIQPTENGYPGLMAPLG